GVARAGAGEFVRFEATHPGPDGRVHHVDFSLTPVTDDAGKVVMLIPEGRDVTDRKRAEQLAAVQHAVACLLADAGPLPETISRILQAICERLDWTLGDVYVVDPVAGGLRWLQTWHAPDAAL